MAANFRTFDQFVGETELSMKMLHRFIKSSERGLQSAKDEEKALLDEQAKQIKGEFTAVIGAFIDHHQAHSEEIPRILRYSQIFAIHALYERELDKLCKEVGLRKDDLPKKVEDVVGYPKLRALRSFLTNTVDASITVWDSLRTFTLARNCIAHGNGFIEGLEYGRDDLESRIPMANGLSLKDGRLQVDETFVDFCYDAVFTLFTEAFENLGFGEGWPSSKFADECAIIIDEDAKTVQVISDDADFDKLLEKGEKQQSP